MDTYFDVEDHVIVTNPTDETFSWTVAGEREYSVEPGQVKRLHGSAAGLFVKKMTDLLIIQANKVPNLYDKELRKEMSERLIVRVIKDNEDIADEEVADLVEVARKNDVAPAQEAEAFPEIKKTAEKEVIEDKELKDEPAEPAKPAKSTAKSKKTT